METPACGRHTLQQAAGRRRRSAELAIYLGKERALAAAPRDHRRKTLTPVAERLSTVARSPEDQAVAGVTKVALFAPPVTSATGSLMPQ